MMRTGLAACLAMGTAAFAPTTSTPVRNPVHLPRLASFPLRASVAPSPSAEAEAVAPLSSFAERAHLYGEGDPSHELTILQTITERRREDVAAAKAEVSLEELAAKARELDERLGGPLDLKARVDSEARGPRGMGIAAEFKRASPSKGDIAVHLDAAEQGRAYGSVGAAVLSVLTEKHWFKGTLDDMYAVREATQKDAEQAGRERPAVLRKDFIVDEYQLAEARAYGADTVLLIVAILEVSQLKFLIESCRSTWGMEPLVEVHTDEELEIALSCGARVMGVNNRNLHTFQLDLATTERVAARLLKGFDQEDRPMVLALSGISGPADVDRYRSQGVAGVLVGEALMRAKDPAEAIETLLGGALAGDDRLLVKVCGVTRPEDARAACQSGASLIGVIFAPKSKRRCTGAQAKLVVDQVRSFGERTAPVAIPIPRGPSDPSLSLGAKLGLGAAALRAASARTPLVVGVFQDQTADEVKSLALESGVDLVQYHGSESDQLVDQVGLPALRVLHLPAMAQGGEAQGQTGGAARAAALRAPGGAAERAALGSDWVLALLLDTQVAGAQGGTGLAFDWSTAQALSSSPAEGAEDGALPVLVAGGLTPESVKRAVGECGGRGSILGVDASSALETEPGVKDLAKLEAFVAGALEAAKA